MASIAERERRVKRHVLPQVKASFLSGTYEAVTLDYEKDLPDGTNGRKAWTEIFRRAIPQFQKRATIQLIHDASSEDDEKSAASRAASFAAEYNRVLDRLEANPDEVISGYEVDFSRAGTGGRKGKGGLSCKVLCAIRETCLNRIGLKDAFKHVKRKENIESLLVLDHIVAEVEKCRSAVERMELSLRGCFAGNLFDLGAHFTSEKYEESQMQQRVENPWQAFQRTRENLPRRPWLIDCLDIAVQELSQKGRFKKAIVFADNAGSDLICGILPFCRELIKAGTRVVIAANEKPSINDITAEELVALFTRLDNSPRVKDQLLCRSAENGMLQVVSSGSDLPIIDLAELSEKIVEEAEDADLIVLQGMGRAIESNLNACFSSSVLKMGVVKHPEVALCLGGKLGQPICKFESVERRE